MARRALTWPGRVCAWFDRHAGAVLVCLALTMGGLYVVQVYQASERAACQASYNRAFAVQLTTRTNLAAQSDRAQSDLLSGVSKAITAKPTTDPKVADQRRREFLLLFDRFDRAADAVERARKATPLPAIPDCT